jgi:hypothetical protein
MMKITHPVAPTGIYDPDVWFDTLGKIKAAGLL